MIFAVIRHMWWPWLIVLLATVSFTLASQLASRQAFARFARRASGIAEWQLAFPDVSDEDIRQFLAMFTDAFVLNRDHGEKFLPGDVVWDVYRAKYPPRWSLGDCMEIENFSISLERQYGLKELPPIPDKVTLGEVFRKVRAG